MLQEEKHDNMEKSEHTKKKTPIVLIGLLAIAIATATIAWGLSKGRTDDLPADENVSSGQEEDDGLVVEGKATASDEAVLRKLLLKDEEITINVTDDIEIQKELVVNGKKTLKGDGKLQMWLAAVDEQAVLSVPEDASLTIEGVSLDGNGISDGVRVEAGGELTYKSGAMEYTAEYGVRCSGIATLEELYIENAMFCGVYAENGGKVYLNDCSMKDAKQNFVHVANGGYAEVTGTGTYENCLARSFSNEGTLVVNGESSTSDENQPIKLINTYFGFLNQGEGELSITGVSVDSSDRSAVYSNGGIVNIKNSFFKNQTNAALQVGEDAEMNLENITIKDCANAGVYASDKTKVTINGLDIDGCRRGVNSCGGKIIGQNVSVKDPVVFGAASYSEKGNRGYVELKNLKVIKAGNAGLYAYEGDLKVTNGEITDSEKYGVDTVAGAVVTLKNVNVKNSADHNYWIGKKSECTVSGKSVVSNGKIRNIYVDGILTMSSSTICDVKNNADGAGVYVDERGTFNMNGGTVKNNHTGKVGGGIFLKGTANVNGVVFENNIASGAGGAIRVRSGVLNVHKCTFMNNSATASSGGGITVEGAKVSVKNSEFSKNTASNDGGALHIANTKASVSVNSCKFTENIASGNKYSAGGAIIATMGNCDVVNSLFSKNSADYLGGAVENRSGAFQGINCTFENNTAKNGGAISQNGSGSATLTVETGKSGKLQKNAATGFGGAVYTNNQGTVTIDGYSIFENKSDSAGGAFYINNSNVTINNSGVQDNTSDRAGAGVRLVSGELTVNNSTFAGNNSTSSSGGAITVEGAKATISNTVFTENTAKENGGALHIANEAADVTLDACTLSVNTVSGAGGALYIDNGKVTINNSGVQTNTSGSAGAGIRIVKGKLIIDGSRFEGNNSPSSSGGAITVQGAEAVISNTDFIENKAKGDGGALHLANAAADVTLDTCTFTENNASGNQYSVGGAVYIDLGNCKAVNTTFEKNNAGYLGGAINNRIGTFQGINCTFENNTATKGGAVSQNGAGSATFTVEGEDSGIFKGNEATDRAGAVNVQDGTVSIAGYVFKENSANDGTDVYVCYSKKLAISDCNFVNNGEVKLEQGAIVDISGNLAGAVFVNKGIAALNVANSLEESEDNIISITPSSYAKGTKVLSKGEAVSDAQWEYAYKSIKVTPDGDDASWYVDKDGCLQSSAVNYVASIGAANYATFSEAMTAANANGGTGDAAAVVVTLHANTTIDAQVDITKNITITNTEGVDVTLTRGTNYTGNLFDINVDNVTFTLGNNEQNATGTITVNASSANAIGGRTIYNHKETSTVVLGKNATLTGAKGSSAGAALANLGTAHLYGNMTNNSSTSNGGAINHASTKKLYVYSGNYTNNTATGKCGGAIYNDAGGNIIISGGTFSGNKAAKGGAIYCMYNASEGYKLTISGGTFEKNEATNNADSGGAVYLQRTKALISGGTFKENVATYRGGAIQCNADGTNKCVLDITGGTFTGNVSKTQGGGAISALNTTANISGATMQGNVCLNKDSDTYMGGGALLIQQNAIVTLSNCTINGNTTVGEGDAAADTGFDIGFRGQSNANLILADETFAGSIGWIFGDTAVNVTIGSNNSPITLTKGIYTVDYTNKALKQTQ